MMRELPINFLGMFSFYILLLSILFVNLAHSHKKELLTLIYKYIPPKEFNKLIGNPEPYQTVKYMAVKEGKGMIIAAILGAIICIITDPTIILG
jgi:hypothetical protein